MVYPWVHCAGLALRSPCCLRVVFRRKQAVIVPWVRATALWPSP